MRRNLLWLLMGHLAVCLGSIGLALPLLPSTPFLLLAAYCYSKSSSQFEQWLLTHRQLGPGIRLWRQQGAIATSAKTAALSLLTINLVYINQQQSLPLLGRASASLVMMAAAAYIASRPRPSPQQQSNEHQKP